MKVNINKLRNICTMSEDSLIKYITLADKQIENYGSFLYKKTRKAKILSVAHMDVAAGMDGYLFRSYQKNGDIHVFSPTLDDRLGIFTILNILPQYGIRSDILFTTDEERCMSTAEDFSKVCDKEYNWIIQFDRAGEDVVLYEYEDDPGLSEDLKEVGFQISMGSYSDICELESLSTGAFNMGIGYHFQHTPQCMAYMTELSTQMYKLQKFYKKFEEKKYTHVEQPRRYRWKGAVFNWRDLEGYAGYEDEHYNPITGREGYLDYTPEEYEDPFLYRDTPPIDYSRLDTGSKWKDNYKKGKAFETKLWEEVG